PLLSCKMCKPHHIPLDQVPDLIVVMKGARNHMVDMDQFSSEGFFAIEAEAVLIVIGGLDGCWWCRCGRHHACVRRMCSSVPNTSSRLRTLFPHTMGSTDAREGRLCPLQRAQSPNARRGQPTGGLLGDGCEVHARQLPAIPLLHPVEHLVHGFIFFS